MNKNIKKILVILVALGLLVGAFIYDGLKNGQAGPAKGHLEATGAVEATREVTPTVSPTEGVGTSQTPAATDTPAPTDDITPSATVTPTEVVAPTVSQEPTAITSQEPTATATPVPTDAAKPTATKALTPSATPTVATPTSAPGSQEGKTITCSIEIECLTAINYKELNPATLSLLPKDGCILAKKQVEIAEGASVFDLLKKVVEDNNINLEYSITPIYNTAYIEGIGNLYQFDCGNLSGWMYSVNGEFVQVGASEAKLKDGDKISWRYTCKLGKDL